MKKSQIKIDRANETLVMTKAFYNKTTVYNSKEYKELEKAMKDTGYTEIEFSSAGKKTYAGLNLPLMKAYIPTQANAEDNMAHLNEMEEAGDAFPTMKKWFLKTYKGFSVAQAKQEISSHRIEEAGTKARVKVSAAKPEPINFPKASNE